MNIATLPRAVCTILSVCIYVCVGCTNVLGNRREKIAVYIVLGRKIAPSVCVVHGSRIWRFQNPTRKKIIIQRQTAQHRTDVSVAVAEHAMNN